LIDSLLEPDFLEKLDGLAVLGRRRRGNRMGEHLAWRRGTSLEFEDYRDYQPGDDIRYLDWNVWSRLGRYEVKRFAAEEDMTVHLLVDASGSMGFGSPSKFHLAVRVAASLGYIAWRRMDKVALAAFSGNLGEVITPARRRGGPTELFGALSRLQAKGETRFNESLTRYALGSRRPGLAVVVSDLLDPRGYTRGLDALRYRRYDILLIHVLCRDDLVPPSRGALQLIDGETGENRKIRMDRNLSDRYRRVAGNFVEEAESFCRRRGIEYIRARSEVPFQDLVLAYLRGGAFLR
jgi:uncharacterized protein (DUF58 family)